MNQRPSSPKDRPSRSGLFIRRQKRLLRPLFGLAMMAALGGGAWFAVQVPAVQDRILPLRDRLLGTAALRITNIRIEGAQLTDEAAIRQALGVRVGDPVLSFNVLRARAKLNTLPFIDHVAVSRHLSGEIEVQIVERPPYAVWQHQGQFMLIDRQGQRVPDQGSSSKDATAFTRLPLVVGDGANEAAATLIDLLAQEPEVKSRVTAAVRVSNRRWNLTLRDGATVLLPEGEEEPAIHRLAKLDATTRLLDRPVLLIDMRLPDRLTIRERPTPADTAPPAGGSTPAAHPQPAAPDTTRHPQTENAQHD